MVKRNCRRLKIFKNWMRKHLVLLVLDCNSADEAGWRLGPR